MVDVKTVEEIDKLLKFIEENTEDVKNAFSLFDKKGKGTVSTKKLIMVMRTLGQNPTEDELDDLINEFDTDGNGFIDFIEFTLMAFKLAEDLDETMREAFSVFDKDGSGSITHSEFRNVMMEEGGEQSGMNTEDIDMIIQEVDKDGDGQINMEEFVKMLIGGKE